MIIGLTGSIASGKGIVSEFLKNKGFVYLSLSDEVREVARRNNIEITRENLQKIGNRLREEHGSGVLGKLIREKIISEKYPNVIVDGIRNPAEIDELEKLKEFLIVCVDAPPEIRFKRMIERNRESDPKTWEEFMVIDSRDKGIGELSTGQNVGKCMARAKFVLINDKNLEEMQEKINQFYIKIQNNRPSWDEYFMKMTSLVAERSTCHRHHVGAVIVKNKRVLTTGYNGAVRGVKDCLELGCRKDELNLASGFGSEECRAVHAEQNAIIQAALHGINTEGATLYCTTIPCRMCAKEIVNAGIKELVTYSDYAGAKGSIEFLEQCGVKFRKTDRPSNIISFKD